MRSKKHQEDPSATDIYKPQHTDLPGYEFPDCQIIHPDTARAPLLARRILGFVSQVFQDKRIVGKYISSEAAKRATEYPLPVSTYIATRLFFKNLAKSMDWEKAKIFPKEEIRLNDSCVVQDYAVKAPSRFGREVSAGRINVVFLDNHDILPLFVSQLMPDTYASRLNSENLNQVAKEYDFTALFAGPMQPDTAIQFCEEIRFGNSFKADRGFIFRSLPFYTASPLSLSTVPETDTSRSLWQGKSSTDIGGIDHSDGKFLVPNLVANATSQGFTYHLAKTNEKPKDGFLFHPAGVEGGKWTMEKARRTESLSVLVKYSGQKDGWAVIGNWGSFMLSLSEQAKLVEKIMSQTGRRSQFILFRDHSGAVGVSFPGRDLAFGLPPKIFGVTEQHTLAAMFGAVPKEKSKEAWERLCR